MNVNDIYTNNLHSYSRIDSSTLPSQDNFFTAGTIIEGTVTKAFGGEAEAVSFFDGQTEHEIKLPKGCVQNTYKGDLRRFEVVEASAEKLVLKDLGSVIKNSSSGIHFSTVDTQLSALVEDFSETMGDKEKDGSSTIANLSDEDYSELRHEGFSIEDFKAERLTRAIARVKTAIAVKKELAENGSKKIREEEKEIKKQAFRSLTGQNPVKLLVAQTLEAADLPVTAENIAALTCITVTASAAAELSVPSEAYLLKNSLAPTVSNIYNAVYSGRSSKTPLTDSEFEELRLSALRVVDAAAAIISDATQNNENLRIPMPSLADARTLLENDVPLTEDNLVYYEQLNELAAAAKDDDFGYRVMEAGAQAIADGLKADDALLISKNPFDSAKHTFSTSLIRDINHRLEIEGIRLRLTMASASTMYKMGIKIEPEAIENIITGLEELRREYYHELAEELELFSGPQHSELLAVSEGFTDSAISAIVPDSDAAAALAINVEKYVSTIREADDRLLAGTFSERHSVTITRLYELAPQYTNSPDPAAAEDNSDNQSLAFGPALSALRQATASYEGSATEIRRDLGDNINKAFRNVDSLLELEGLETTEANRRAVRILGRNSMEISAENIASMKYYDAKLSRLIENLQPTMVMTLIKRGINPLYTDIDTLSGIINEITDSEGPSAEENYAEFLVRAEEHNNITDAERNAYIGIYRLLYRISLNDSEALGAIIGTGRELTLANLLTEERTATGRGINSLVGEAEPVQQTASGFINSITEQIDEAFAYQNSLLNDMLSCTSPRAWNEAVRNEKTENMSLEHLAEKLNNADISFGDTDFSSAAIVRNALSNRPAGAFLKAFGLDNSTRNIRSLVSDELLPADRDSLIEASASADALNSFTEALTDEAEKNIMQQFKNNITAATAGELTMQLDRYGLLGTLSGHEHYSFTLNDSGHSNVRLTFIHNSDTKASVSIRLDTDNSTVNAEMSVTSAEDSSQPSVSGMLGYNGDSDEILRKNDVFLAALKDMGFDTESLGISKGINTKSAYFERLGTLKTRAAADHVSDNTLYRLAQAFITSFTA